MSITIASLHRQGAASLVAVALLCCAGAGRAETPLERGEYLVRVVAACGNCHTPFGANGPDAAKELAGRLIDDNEAFTAWAPNITPDAETGIGRWTDAQIARAIREGVRPDGSIIGPPMPIMLYRNLSDTDLAAMVAFLRTLPAVKNDTPASVYRIPLPPSYGPPVTHVADVPRDDPVAYGGYLAGPVAHCLECHTPMGPEGHPDFEHALGAGGFVFRGPWGASVAANLTSHDDGLARYTDAEVADMIRHGVRPGGLPMLPPMGYGYYARMTDADTGAIIAFLRTLPPLPSRR